MNLVKVSSKNQITLPVAVLKNLKISSGSRLSLEEKEGILILSPQRISFARQSAGSLKKYISEGKTGVPFDEVQKETYKLVSARLAKKYD